MPATDEIKVKRKMELQDTIQYFENLLSGLKQGKVVLKQGDEFVTLQLEDNLTFEIKAKDKKSKSKLSIEISYKKPKVAVNPSMVISSQEPAVA